MKVCVAGKNSIAIEIAKCVLALRTQEKIELCGLVNSTDHGIDSWQPSYRKWLIDNNIPVVALEQLYAEENLVFLSMEYEKLIVPERFQDARLYNIHFSLLPAYRGMYTSAMPILNGEQQSGVTLHKIDAGIDSGDIIAQLPFALDANETARSLYHKYLAYGTKLVKENLLKILSAEETAVPQNLEDGSYYSRAAINYKVLELSFTCSAEQVVRQIRAFSFREYQLPSYDNEPIIDAAVTNIDCRDVPSGQIMTQDETAILVAADDYGVILYKDRFEILTEACKSGNITLVKDICAVSQHINAQDSRGRTPLMFAVYNHQIDVAIWLILHGADCTMRNFNGTDLLMYAKECYRKTQDETLFRLFQKLAVPTDRKDRFGKSIRDYCLEEGIPLLTGMGDNNEEAGS